VSVCPAVLWQKVDLRKYNTPSTRSHEMMYHKKIGVEKWVKKWGTKPEATKNFRVENWGTKLEPPAWTEGGAQSQLVSIWGYGKVVSCY